MRIMGITPRQLLDSSYRFQGIIPGFTEDLLKGYPSPFNQCFPGSTEVLMVDSDCKTIAEVAVGDFVTAFDRNGQLATRRVTRLYRNVTKEWTKLTWQELNEANTHFDRELITTPGHRFLDRFGNFPTIEEMIEDGEATVILGSKPIDGFDFI